ncbi:(Fe-S)-binding protein, partial [candidate division CSSED10-310 bacterium]
AKSAVTLFSTVNFEIPIQLINLRSYVLAVKPATIGSKIMFNEQEIRSQLKICVKCGKCLTRCPVYRETRDEKVVARGKISLAQAYLEGEIGLSETLARAAAECLYCLNCQDSCPNGIPMDMIIPFLRKTTAYHSKITATTHNIITKTVAKSGHVRQFARAASIVSRLLARQIPPERGIHLKLSLPNFPSRRLLPGLAQTSFVESIPEMNNLQAGKKTIAFFVGCLHNYLDVPTGLATLRVLNKMGYDVWIPKNQTCCGLPFLSAGMDEAYRRLAEQNREVFSPHTTEIVTTCPSCATTIRKHYQTLGTTGAVMARGVVDLSTFLWEHRSELEAVLSPGSITEFATYHDPCHLAHGLDVRHQPRALLKLLYQDNFMELSQADRCCGGGGSFSLTHYDLSQKICASKVKNIAAWKVKVQAKNRASQQKQNSSLTEKTRVVTACPLCEIQLRDALKNNNVNVAVTHLADEIARHLKP